MFSIGLFINDVSDLDKLRTLHNVQVQLGFYRVHMYRDFGVRTLEICKERNITMESVHLPTKDMNVDLVHEIMCLYNVEKATIHAHDNIMKMLEGELSWKICLENFPYKSDRTFRTPIDIIRTTATNPKLGMTFDMCHAEILWLDPIILSSILKYTDIIHMSNKLWDKKPKEDGEYQAYQNTQTAEICCLHPLQKMKLMAKEDKDEVGKHLPIHGIKGTIIDIDNFLSVVLKQYHWKGEIVIEYMPRFFEKAKSDYRKLRDNWGKFLNGEEDGSTIV